MAVRAGQRDGCGEFDRRPRSRSLCGACETRARCQAGSHWRRATNHAEDVLESGRTAAGCARWISRGEVAARRLAGDAAAVPVFAALLESSGFHREIAVVEIGGEPGDDAGERAENSTRSVTRAPVGIGSTAWNAWIHVAGAPVVQVKPRPGSSAVTFHTAGRSFGWRTRARLPMRSGPLSLSSRRMPRTEAVHSCQRSTSVMMDQTRSGGAEMSTEMR